MSHYRRNYVEGGTFFFTVVTYKRQPLLTDVAVDILRESFRECMYARHFTIEAIVVLPEHIHCIWQLPAHNYDYSVRWKEIKDCFTKEYIRRVGEPAVKPTASMLKKGEKGIWQRRFWEHTIQDEDDYRMHIDYIHYNPVKHGLVNAPKNWPYSSFHRFVKKGILSELWAGPAENFPEGIGGE